MATGYGSGSTKEAVKSIIDGLETSPSKTQSSSPVYGTRRGGDGGAESAAKSVPGFKDKKGGRSGKDS
jgi:hypothetical protein